MLKASEGVASSISQILKQEIETSPLRLLGGLLLKGALPTLRKKSITRNTAAHRCLVSGAIAAAKARECKVLLVGDERDCTVLSQSGVAYGENERVEVVHCSDYIRMAESATDALKRKESSIYIATDLVREGQGRCACIHRA